MLKIISALTAVFASTAFAHHGMDGQLPTTFFQGLISGVAHPVIGFDHLAFLIAMAAAAAYANRNFVLPLAFVVTTIVGAFVHFLSVDIPANETIIALSVLLTGVAVLNADKVSTNTFIALFAISGLFHGYQYAESIIGAETAVVSAYLVGFGAIQALVAFVAMNVVSKSFAVNSTVVKTIGAVVLGFGLSLVTGSIF